MAYKKKLIEVALPLQAINEACIREKSIRHGHPSTLHLYWARRPLAAARAVIFASLIDDPSNDKTLSEDEVTVERNKIFTLLTKLVQWKNINDTDLLLEARELIYKSNNGIIPPILDPFCGAGTIPLEGQRLGLEAYGSDLNPVAVMVSKATVELPHKACQLKPINPEAKNKTDYTLHWKGATGLANDVRYYGKWMFDQANKRIGKYYPLSSKKEKVVAWIWTRTVKCPNPSCGVIVPLARSFLLHKKKGLTISIKPEIIKNEVRFSIDKTGLPISGTMTRNGATCFCCNSPVPIKYIRSEGRAKRMGKKMMAIITEGQKGRNYYSPQKDHIFVSESANPHWKPDYEMVGKTTVSLPLYGMNLFSDIFTNRQLLALDTFSTLVMETHKKVLDDGGSSDYADIVATYLAFAVDRSANYWSSLTPWGGGFVVQTFGRQALPMVWDFAEANPFSNSTGNWNGAIDWIARVLDNLSPNTKGEIDQIDAAKAIYDVESPLICTDPPYYDNIMYADLSDYFYVWLRHSIKEIYPKYFSTMLTPKDDEIVASPWRHQNQSEADTHFLNGMMLAAKQIAKNANPNFPVTYFYAFKQSETDEGGATASTGWETFLEGLIRAGYAITATWPMRTERDQGLKTSVNALASSIVVALRKKEKLTKIATRREFVKALSEELEIAIIKMMESDITPVDLQQSAIGPGMAVFTRFAKVLEADGTSMSVKTALQIINAELDRIQESSEIEMDSDTRFCIQWFDTYCFDQKLYGEAETLARAKDTSVDGLVNAGVFIAGGGKAKLKHWSDMITDWDPRKDNRLTLWECTHHMIRELIDGDGQIGAAKLAKFMGNQKAEEAKELAYQLYHICDKRKWAKHAGDYNTLVANWADIKSQIPNVSEGQETLF